MCMTLHLFTLNSICHCWDHCTSLYNSSWSPLPSLYYLFFQIVSYRQQTLKSKPQSKSLIYTRNSIGPNTEPCGTPLNTSIQSDSVPLIPTLCTLHLNHSAIQFSNLFVMLWDCNFTSSLLCGTLSKAFAKSRKITSTPSSVSKQPVTLSRNASTFDRQDLPLRNPCCES